MVKNPNKRFKHLGPSKTGNALTPQVPDKPTKKKKTIGPLPQQGLLKPLLNNYFKLPKKITSDPDILHVVSGYQIPFHSVPVQ